MRKPNIYICGNEPDKENENTKKMKEMLSKLKCTIIDPKEQAFSKMNWSDTLQSRIEQIKNSDIIYVLPNWKDDVMNRIEVTVAMDMKLHTLFHPVSNKEIKQLLATLDS